MRVRKRKRTLASEPSTRKVTYNFIILLGAGRKPVQENNSALVSATGLIFARRALRLDATRVRLQRLGHESVPGCVEVGLGGSRGDVGHLRQGKGQRRGKDCHRNCEEEKNLDHAATAAAAAAAAAAAQDRGRVNLNAHQDTADLRSFEGVALKTHGVALGVAGQFSSFLTRSRFEQSTRVEGRGDGGWSESEGSECEA